MGIRDTEASDLMKLPGSKVMLIVLLVNYRWEKKKEELWAARLSNCSVGATFALSFRLNKPQHLLFAIINRRFG